MKKLPESFEIKAKELFGEEYDLYLKSLEEERVYGFRSNTLKIEPEKLIELMENEYDEVKWCSNGYYYDGKENITKSPLYYAGLYYVQEPSAMSSASIIPINEGDRVLDVCAAPGGKTTQLAAKLRGTGIIISNDISFSRTLPLVKNVEKYGIANSIVMSEDPENMKDVLKGYFDKIIIDAPCSGEGMFRKDKNAIPAYEDRGSEYCIPLQRSILRSCAEMLKPGGLILYSTCTFSKEENEDIILEFLNENKEFKALEIPKEKGYSEGYELKEAARLLPHKVKGEGHFVALIQKDITKDVDEVKSLEIKEDRNAIDVYRKFEKENLKIKLEGSFEYRKDNLFYIPFETPDTKKLRVVRKGLKLGEIKKDRFKPSQALAMYLKMEDFKNVINYGKDDINVIKYLKGETLQIGNDIEGLVLICAEGYPLGFGKASRGKLKNNYDKGWRLM
ncbi:MAG: RsmB/NOP family class I SAM-dependent RNA methyltransferase [Clostridia bacterium]|jgi:NOL1/NOP2/sun family putative RNA methylase|nr:RsmB/NOP family class I SAM-dependent RNA methyltransferase [Clostridia bacterium]